MRTGFVAIFILLTVASCSDPSPQNVAPVIGNSMRSWCQFQTNCTVTDPDKTSNAAIP
jgi:hypothetical protein